MKAITAYFSSVLLVVILVSGCDSFLDEDVYSQLAPDNFLNTEVGVRSVLNAAYAEVTWTGGTGKYRTLHVSDFTTDIAWQTGGGENREAAPMITFSWDPATNVHLMYNRPYDAIRDANVVLDNIDAADMTAEKKELYAAEAGFIRALAYQDLYNWFGPVSLKTSGTQPLEQPRASEEEMKQFIETEYLAIIDKLPFPGQEEAYGRATSGAARGFLMRFYLNTKQWQKAADMAQSIIQMGYYSLYPVYGDMFKVENEGNREMIWVDATSAFENATGNAHMNGTFPPGFDQEPKTGLKMQPNWANWASQYRIYDDFYNSFEEGDARRDPIITEYINKQGKVVKLLGSDNTRAFKYWPDPNASGNAHGNDHPRVRYADVLLVRAEALNELNGPNQESINLINEVRARAGLAPLSLADFGSKEALREQILEERGWEFYYEGLRREDLIRMDKFIEYARERGVSHAQEFHRRFPIPQAAMDANPSLQQNPGY